MFTQTETNRLPSDAASYHIKIDTLVHHYESLLQKAKYLALFGKTKANYRAQNIALLAVSWTKSKHSTPLQAISIKCILILSSHLCLGLRNGM